MAAIFKQNTVYILFLIALLVVILLIMSYLKSDKSSFLTTDTPVFEGSFKIIDNKYYNKLYNFQISIPSKDWEISTVETIDSLHQQDNSKPILDNINIMLELYRRDLADTLAKIQVGIIKLDEPQTPSHLAQQSLNENRLSVLPPDSLKVIKDVTLSGSVTLRSAYYMIEFPNNLKYQYPVQVAMFVVYDKLAYVVFCHVRSNGYELLRSDLESTLRSFHLFKA